MYLPRVKTIPILLPLACLYGIGVWFRNKAFDRGILKETSFDIPIISVGNVAAGGTGKTPHTEYLIRLLQREEIGPIAVLSRGYKRHSKGFVLATPEITAAKLGDESYQIYRKFPGLIVAVDTKRVRGIRQLLALPEPPAVILLDDAFQHRYVKAGLNIVLTSYNRILYKDLLLPAGLLREPRHSVRRADLVVVSKCPPALRLEETTEIEGHLPTDPTQPICYSTFCYQRPINLASGQPADIDHTCQVLLVTGIADPEVLAQYIQTHYRLLDSLAFSDHHHFSNADIATIRQHLDQINSGGNCTNNSSRRPVIITTEKDAVRLMAHPAVTDDLKQQIFYLPAEVSFIDRAQPSCFDRYVLDYIRNGKKPQNT
jgi:tetraacyldisaccharide 4'-kinase